MLNSYIETLRKLCEQLTSHNVSTFDDIVTAWKLSAQIMAMAILPICIIITCVVLHVLGHRFLVYKVSMHCAGISTKQYLGMTIGYSVFTLLVVVPFILPIVLYFI